MGVTYRVKAFAQSQFMDNGCFGSVTELTPWMKPTLRNDINFSSTGSSITASTYINNNGTNAVESPAKESSPIRDSVIALPAKSLW